MKKNKQKRQAAFTLIELLVVSTIIIVLTMIGIVSFQTASQKSKEAKCNGDLQTVRQALVMYRSENGSYPIGDDDDWPGLIDTLKSGYLSSSDDYEHPISTEDYEVNISSNSFTLTAPNCLTTGGSIIVSSP